MKSVAMTNRVLHRTATGRTSTGFKFFCVAGAGERVHAAAGGKGAAAENAFHFNCGRDQFALCGFLCILFRPAPSVGTETADVQP